MSKIIVEINPNFHEVIFNYNLNETEIKFNGKHKLDFAKFELNKPSVFMCPYSNIECDKYDYKSGEILISCVTCTKYPNTKIS